MHRFFSVVIITLPLGVGLQEENGEALSHFRVCSMSGTVQQSEVSAVFAHLLSPVYNASARAARADNPVSDMSREDWRRTGESADQQLRRVCGASV